MLAKRAGSFLALTAFAMVAGIGVGTANCAGDLFSCASQTPISTLEFGLHVFADELSSSLVERRILPQEAWVRNEVAVSAQAAQVRLFVFDSGLTCKQIAVLLPNYVGRWRSMAGIYAQPSEIESWRTSEPDPETIKHACLSLSAFIAPRAVGDVTDTQLRTACERVSIEVLAFEKAGMTSKPCSTKFSQWEPRD